MSRGTERNWAGIFPTLGLLLRSSEQELRCPCPLLRPLAGRSILWLPEYTQVAPLQFPAEWEGDHGRAQPPLSPRDWRLFLPHSAPVFPFMAVLSLRAQSLAEAPSWAWVFVDDASACIWRHFHCYLHKGFSWSQLWPWGLPESLKKLFCRLSRYPDAPSSVATSKQMWESSREES